VVLRRDDPTFLWSWTRPYNEISGKLTAREMATLAHAAALKTLTGAESEQA
jgi:hypothetical protein